MRKVKRQIDPLRCPVKYVWNYVTFPFESFYTYRTTCCNRSSLSTLYDKVDGFTLGEHRQICSLVLGVFNKRPPQQKYSFFLGCKNSSRLHKR